VIFKKLSIEGAFRIESEPFADIRGVFRRSFCEKEFRWEKCNRLLQLKYLKEKNVIDNNLNYKKYF